MILREIFKLHLEGIGVTVGINILEEDRLPLAVQRTHALVLSVLVA